VSALIDPDEIGYYSKEGLLTITPANPVDGQPVGDTLGSENQPVINTVTGPITIVIAPLHVCCFTSAQYRAVYNNDPNMWDRDDNRRGYEEESDEIDRITNTNWWIYPNPATSDIVISNNFKGAYKAKVILYDLTGKIVFKERFLAESISGKTIDVSEFDRGMYTLRLISPVAKEANFKVILE
jgi:hypothetical protein